MKQFLLPWWVLLVIASLIRVAMFTDVGQAAAASVYQGLASLKSHVGQGS